jgi:hypothetical protein
MTGKFNLGQTVATPGALEALNRAGQEPVFFLRKHVSGDWGDVDGFDEKANQIALREGGRLFSVYRTLRNEIIWVITEADRSSTCLLLPEEY